MQWTSAAPNAWVPIYGTVDHPANPIPKIDSATPALRVSQQEEVINDANAQITGTFTTSTSTTFTSATLSGTSVSADIIQRSVSDSVGETIAISVTTLFGVSATTPVPPDSEVIGQYGTNATT